jgi:hypothetical protein
MKKGMIEDLLERPFKEIKGTPVLIEWDDSTNVSIGWHIPEEVESTMGKMFTLGFIIGLEEDRIAISHTMAHGRAYDKYVIPIGCIAHMQILEGLYASEE